MLEVSILELPNKSKVMFYKNCVSILELVFQSTLLK